MRQHMGTRFQLFSLDAVEIRIIFYGIHDSLQFIAQEDGDDGRRRFIASQTVIVSGAGHRDTQKIRIVIHCLDDSH